MRLQSGQTGYLDGSCLGTQPYRTGPPPGDRSHAIQRYGPWIRSVQNDRRRHLVTNRRLLGLRTLQHRRAGTLVRVAQRFGVIGEQIGKSHGALLSSYSTIRLHSIIDSRRYPRNPLARNPHTSTHPCRASRHPATYNATYNAAHDATPTPHTAPHALPHTPTRQQCTLGSTKHTTSGRL